MRAGSLPLGSENETAAQRFSDVVDALDVQSSLRRLGNGEEVVHLETHTALGIRPTPFAEFARRHTADFLGTSAWAMAQKGRKHPLDLRTLPSA